MNKNAKRNEEVNAPDHKPETSHDTLYENEEANEIDNEMSALFSALDGLHASEPLKARTLDLLEEKRTEATGPTRTAIPGGKLPEKKTSAKQAKRKTKLRAFRVAAVAACLVLALTGGAAYAIPTSYVQVTQGGASINLGINRFGLVVSADSKDDAGRAIVAKGGLTNIPYDDALARAATEMDESQPNQPFEATVNSGDGPQRERLENKNREFMTERNQRWNPASEPTGGEAGGWQNSWQPEGTPQNWQPENDQHQPDSGQPQSEQPGGQLPNENAKQEDNPSAPNESGDQQAIQQNDEGQPEQSQAGEMPQDANGTTGNDAQGQEATSAGRPPDGDPQDGGQDRMQGR